MEAKSDSLDVLYTEYLNAIREIILQTECQKDIDLCTEWLDFLNHSPAEQKVARNCLASLMFEQLKKTETIAEPFRDLPNLNRDLESILQGLGLDASTTNCTELDSVNSSSREDNIQNLEDQLPQYSCKSEQSVISQSSYHIQHLDNPNTFFNKMKSDNEALYSEVCKLRRENEILYVKNEQKNIEMQKLLYIFKGCPNCDILSDEVVKESTAVDEKHNAFQIYPTQEDQNIYMMGNNDHGDGFRIVQINEEDIFDALNNLIKVLKTNILDENSLETIGKLNIMIFSQMFEKCSNAPFLTKIALYENNIQMLAQQLIENIKSYYNTLLKSNKINEVKSVRTGVSSTASQTRNVTYKSSSDGPRHSADFKVKYLRKCLLKMQNSREKLIEKYENKLKDQLLQNRIQQKILKLKLASISSKIFLRSNYKNQEELLALTNHLEAKYKDIIAEAIERKKVLI